MVRNSETCRADLQPGLQFTAEPAAPFADCGTDRPSSAASDTVSAAGRPNGIECSGKVDPAADRRPVTSPVTQGGLLDYIAVDLRPLAVAIADLRPAPGNARMHTVRD